MTTTTVQRFRRGSRAVCLTAIGLLTATSAVNVAAGGVLFVLAVQLLRRSPRAINRLRRWAKLDLLALLLDVAAIAVVAAAFTPPGPVEPLAVIIPAAVAAVGCAYPLAVLAAGRTRAVRASA